MNAYEGRKNASGDAHETDPKQMMASSADLGEKERKEERILNRAVFIGGPPRSGTSFAAKNLNLHPRLMAAIDDHVFECWGLFRYRDRSGLVQDLRTGRSNAEESKRRLRSYLFRDHRLFGAASSLKTSGSPEIPPSSEMSADTPASVLDKELVRHAFPLESFSPDWLLCLKSPEISFVLPALSALFAEAKFVLVYRSLIETAESMFRLGNTVMRFPVYHRRWREEKAEDGTPLTPPGIPQEWTGLWRKATDFQRCAIYAGVYMKALVEGVRDLPPRRYFIYSHDELKEHPAEVFGKMADFLGIEEEGFGAVLRDFMVFSRPVAPGLGKELKKIEREMELHRWEAALDALSRRVS